MLTRAEKEEVKTAKQTHPYFTPYLPVPMNMKKT